VLCRVCRGRAISMFYCTADQLRTNGDGRRRNGEEEPEITAKTSIMHDMFAASA
jgi:hypothetical protein